jgi:hypothetical protein
MGKKATHFNQAMQILQELKKEYPSYHLCQHLSSALGGYKDLWGVADKEMLFALQKYKTELEFNIASDDEVNEIMKDAQNLDVLFEEEEEEDGY